jgi:hypothetical protein
MSKAAKLLGMSGSAAKDLLGIENHTGPKVGALRSTRHIFSIRSPVGLSCSPLSLSLSCQSVFHPSRLLSLRILHPSSRIGTAAASFGSEKTYWLPATSPEEHASAVRLTGVQPHHTSLLCALQVGNTTHSVCSSSSALFHSAELDWSTCASHWVSAS